MFGAALHHSFLLITAVTLLTLVAGCATDDARRAELPDEIREDKERIAQGLAPEHHRTERHVRAAEEEWHRSQILHDVRDDEAARHAEELEAAYEADRAVRAGR